MRLTPQYAVFAALLPIVGFGCRAIIGVDPVSYDPDAGKHDATVADAPEDGGGDDGGAPTCPKVTPTVLFSATGTLYQPFLAGGYVYALIGASNDNSIAGEFSGYVACPTTGCGGTPATPINIVSPDAGYVFGTAAASDAGVFHVLSSLNGKTAPLDASAGSLQATTFDGGDPRALANGLAYPSVVAAAGTDIYFTDDPTALGTINIAQTLFPWRLMHANALSDAGAEVFFNGALGEVVSVFTDRTNVYVLGQDSTENLGLFVCPRTGCTSPPEYVTGLPTTDGNNQFLGIDSFGSDGTSLFHASYGNGTISVIPLATRTETGIVDSENSPTNLQVAGKYVYWATSDGEVRRIRTDGTGDVTPVVCGLTNITGIVVDGSTLYVLATDATKISNTAMTTVPLP